MRRLSPTLLVAATLAFPVAATTQAASAGSGTSLKACAIALEAKCGAVKLGGDRLRACFVQHMSHLPQACSDKLARIATHASACKNDTTKLCGPRPASETYACLKGRMTQIGIPCKAALARIAAQASRDR